MVTLDSLYLVDIGDHTGFEDPAFSKPCTAIALSSSLQTESPTCSGI
jgi:hypothetical protein